MEGNQRSESYEGSSFLLGGTFQTVAMGERMQAEHSGLNDWVSLSLPLNVKFYKARQRQTIRENPTIRELKTEQYAELIPRWETYGFQSARVEKLQ